MTPKALLAAAALVALTISAAAQNPKPDEMVTLNAPFPGCIDLDSAFAANKFVELDRMFAAPTSGAAAYVKQNKNCVWLDPRDEYRVLEVEDFGPGTRNVALCLRPPNADFWLSRPAEADKKFCFWTVLRSKER